MHGPVRKAAVAGSWYPGEARALGQLVEAHLQAAGPPAELSGELLGLVSPHAGLMYSGPVAAHGYALLRGRGEATVVLVGPSHRVAFDGVALAARGAFDTPLGPIPIDEELAASVLAEGGSVVVAADAPHRQEHSLEMQLPFLKHLVPKLRIVPLLMGTQSREECLGLAAALGRALEGRGALLLASTDLSHYQPAEVAHVLDRQVIRRVEQFDPEGLLDLLEVQPGHACGGGPLATVMLAARALGADQATVLRYGDSGDQGARDKTQVVGYLSAALTRRAA